MLSHLLKLVHHGRRELQAFLIGTVQLLRKNLVNNPVVTCVNSEQEPQIGLSLNLHQYEITGFAVRSWFPRTTKGAMPACFSFAGIVVAMARPNTARRRVDEVMCGGTQVMISFGLSRTGRMGVLCYTGNGPACKF